MAEGVDQPAHGAQVRRGSAGVGQHPLEVLMTVEPGQGITQTGWPTKRQG
jgi:hypothetical protein